MKLDYPIGHLTIEAQVRRDMATKLERIRAAAQSALDAGSATGSAVTLAARILSLLEGT